MHALQVVPVDVAERLLGTADPHHPARLAGLQGVQQQLCQIKGPEVVHSHCDLRHRVQDLLSRQPPLSLPTKRRVRSSATDLATQVRKVSSPLPDQVA